MDDELYEAANISIRLDYLGRVETAPDVDTLKAEGSELINMLRTSINQVIESGEFSQWRCSISITGPLGRISGA